MPAQAQIKFLTQFQRLLDEGNFTATYKFALLIAIADLCVQSAASHETLTSIHLDDIAAKFVELYWRQVLPYPYAVQDADTLILSQNTGRPAKILTLVESARRKANGSVSLARRDRKSWQKLIRNVRRTVVDQPLWKLQIIGSKPVEFIYRQGVIADDRIQLLPGACESFRRFHPLILSLAQAAWMRQIRRIPRNSGLLGPAPDLGEFLFGSERASLANYVPVLRELQSGDCFYCEKPITRGSEVDHFIPWSRFPIDLGHNFVLAHKRCNHDKRDFLASVDHLEHWMSRNHEHGADLGAAFDMHGLVHDVSASTHIAKWGYEQAAAADAQVWKAGSVLVDLDPGWASYFFSN